MCGFTKKQNRIAVNLLIEFSCYLWYQRWSPQGRPWPRGRPRGQIFKSLASKVKSLALASKPQVLENCPVLGSRTALFFEWLKFCRLVEKCFSRPFFFWRLTEKKFLRPFFSGKHLHLCPWLWPGAFLSLALVSDFFCVLGLGLEPCVLDSTSVW